MIRWLSSYRQASPQTKYFIWTWVIYSIAIIWTTVQAYARLEYSRTQVIYEPIEESQRVHKPPT